MEEEEEEERVDDQADDNHKPEAFDKPVTVQIDVDDEKTAEDAASDSSILLVNNLEMRAQRVPDPLGILKAIGAARTLQGTYCLLESLSLICRD